MNSGGRRRLALLLRDLSTVAAFGSMAVSGELPVWSLALFGLAVSCSLVGYRPLARAPVLSGAALGLGALGLYASVALGGLDLVVAACSFAGLITAQRMLSDPSPRTDGQVLLTSLLMIAGGAALSGELLFAVLLMLFGALALPALTLNVMERFLGRDTDYPLRRVLRPLGVGVVAAIVGSAVFFVVFPRLSWNVAGRRPSKGLGTVTGLSDGVRLGAAFGEIKKNPRVVARVRLAPDPGTDRLAAYWVAATYGTWSGLEWRDDGTPQPPRSRVTVGEANGASVRQRIELLPAYGSKMALGLQSPLWFLSPQSKLVHVPGRDVRFADDLSTHTYDVESNPAGAPGSGELGEEERARYLSLPELDPRIAPLARRVAGDATAPLEAAARLEQWLGQNLRYTLDLGEGGGADPLANFLFERKQGHCEYFASALTVMLRSLGFPARVATGFYGGERVGSEYVLRAGDAHAWTQVFVPGRGFVGVDATPPAGRGPQVEPWMDWLVRAWERLDAQWRNRVLDYSMRDQAHAVMQVMRPGGQLSRARFALPREAWIAAGLVALSVYALWRFRLWARLRPSNGDDAARLRAEAERSLLRAGVALEDGEGIEELRARLSRLGHPASAPMEALTRRYLQARFGDRPLADGERARLLKPLRDALARVDR